MLLILLNVDGGSIYLGISFQSIIFTLLSLLMPTLFIKDYETKDAFYLISFTLYIGLFYNCVNMIFNQNKYLLLFIILVVVITDTFAYIIGSLIGKHKITSISPKKSWEGTIAGVISGCIVGTFYYMAVISSSNVLRTIVLCIILSIMGQLGDLLFSKIKRENKIKDFSNLIPGHGGILDRFDSLSFAVFVYVLLCTII
jgi:phosphatidate cytidylyltransferase